jgi:ribosome-associated protein
VDKFIRLLQHGLFVAKPRKHTKPTRSSAKKRLETKTKRGNIKRSRVKRIELD